MTSRNRRITQANDIKRRVKSPLLYPPERCAVFGCKRLTQRSAGKGLNEALCKPHSEHLRRHGHESQRSYSKADLEPYRKAALEWYRQRRKDPQITRAIASLESLMASQGRSKDANYQRSMSPEDKARNTLARLHEARKTGLQLLLIVAAVRAAHEDLGPRGAPDWLPVQIAKQAKRLRGSVGTKTGLPHAPLKWPRGEGIYMRHLGRMIEERAAYAIDGEAIKDIREVAKPSASRGAIPSPPAIQPRETYRTEMEEAEALIKLLGRRGSVNIETS